MGESEESLIKAINHYQSGLERYMKRQDDAKMLHNLGRLYKLPIKVCHLEKTGVGRTVNGLRKLDGEVGEAAKSLVAKWKEMVVEEEKQAAAPAEDDDNEEVPDNEEIEEKMSPEVSHDYKKKKRKSESSKHKSDSEEDLKENRIEKHRKRSHHTSEEEEEEEEDNDDDDELNETIEKNNRNSTKNHQERKSRDKHKDKHKSSKHSKNKSKHNSEDKDEKGSRKHKSSKHDKNESSGDRKKHKHKSSHDHERSESKNKDDKKVEKKHESSKHDKEKKSHKDKDSKEEKHGKSKMNGKNEQEPRKSNESVSKKDKGKTKKKSEPSLSLSSAVIHGIGSGSGTSFADALGMCEPPVKKKKTTSQPDLLPEDSQDSDENVSVELPLPKEPLENFDISTLLPPITPNYRPLGLPVNDQPKKILTDDEALSRVMMNKNQRTKVFSGNKITWGKVPSLFELCIRILQDNIDALEYTGGVPYTILKPILEKCTANQLYMMEHHNPYLIDDSDELWKLLCQKEFRNKARLELETWRDMYMRCLDEREAKLRALTANIKQAQDKSLPVRTTKLAYVDSVAKPPRNVARKQAKNSTSDVRPSASAKLASIATKGEASKIAVPNPGARALERSSSGSTHHSNKPKKAPLMAKTLSLFKNRFRR